MARRKAQPSPRPCPTPRRSLVVLGSVPQISAWTLPLELLSSHGSSLSSCLGVQRRVTEPAMPNVTSTCSAFYAL